MGGAQAVLYDLVTNLDAQSFEQKVIYIHGGPYVARLRNAGIAVQQVSGLFFAYDPLFFFRLLATLRKSNPNCLHTLLWSANFFGSVAARMLGIFCVRVLHNNLDQNGMVRNMLDRFVASQTDQPVVAVSQEVKQSYLLQHPNARNVIVVCNGIDIGVVKRNATLARKSRKDMGLIDEHFVIGSVGRFCPVKRYSFLLDSFAMLHKQHNHSRLLIVGSGSQEHDLRAYAQKRGIADYVIWVVDEPAYGYFPLFDCFVMTSEKEGVSIALLEAMSLGVCSVVTYHTQSHSVIINGQDGIVTHEQNAASFAATIAGLVRNQSLRNKLGANAQHAVAMRFAIKNMIATYEQIFRMCDS